MKCSLVISNFPEEISSLSHSVIFLYFFALITEEGFLISPCYSLEVCIQMGISFLFSSAFSLSSCYIQFSSVAQPCLTLCDPMNRSTPGLPVHHQLPEFTQTQVHRVGDAIQPSSSIVPVSSCPQSLPASDSFPMNQLFA